LDLRIGQPRVSPADILDAPATAGGTQEHRAFGPAADPLMEQLPQLATDRDPAGPPRVAGRLVLLERNRAVAASYVADRDPRAANSHLQRIDKSL